MKLKCILSLLFLTLCSLSHGQTKECDCGSALNQDLKDFNSTKEYKDFKNWLYSYYQKDETKRDQAKRDASQSFSGEIGVVIKAIPISAGGDYSNSSSVDKQRYQHTEQFYLKNQYLTDQQVNELFVSQFGNNQLQAYLGCLDLCKGVIGNGVYFYTGGETSDEFYIEVKFASNTGAERITLAGDARYINLEPIGGLSFTEGLVIARGQSRTQYFKRVDPTKAASFTINVRESIAIRPIELPAQPAVNQQAIPVGTIICSVLSYKSFLEANKLDKMNNSNMSIALWVPCDGRQVPESKYFPYAGRVPDLRGVFLRGINTYGDASANFGSVVDVSNAQKNPENKVANEFQGDTFQGHSHNFSGDIVVANDGAHPPTHLTASRPGELQRNKSYNFVKGASTDGTNGTPRVSIETRPKNVTVYYYIRIN
jgi:hypothetical protein